MPTSTVNLDYKAEQSIINWLAASGTHSITHGVANVFHVDATDSFELPAIVVKVEVGTEHIKDSGWFNAVAEVSLHTEAFDTTATAAEVIWQKIRAILGWDELAARLSDLSDFHCWMVTRDTGEGNDILENKTQVRTYRFNLVCMANDNA
jgi:hypothetical protein